jgi:photosystem II stability/assembly factor-like uncharacterized protein
MKKDSIARYRLHQIDTIVIDRGVPNNYKLIVYDDFYPDYYPLADIDSIKFEQKKGNINKLNNRTIIVNNDENYLSSKIFDDSIVLRFKEPDDKIFLGDIIIGTDSIGFLRRVVSIEKNDNNLIIKTEPANLSDAFTDLLIDTSFVPLGMQKRKMNTKSDGKSSLIQVEIIDTTIVDGKPVLSYISYQIDENNNEEVLQSNEDGFTFPQTLNNLYFEFAGIKIKIEKLEILLKFRNIDFKFLSKYMMPYGFALVYNLEQSYDVYNLAIDLTTNFGISKTPILPPIPFFSPLMNLGILCTFQPFAVFEPKIGGILDMKSHTKFNVESKIKTTYNWITRDFNQELIKNKINNIDLNNIEYDNIKAKFEITAGIEGKFGFYFLGFIGPEAKIRPNLNMSVEYPICDVLCKSGCRVEGTIGINLFNNDFYNIGYDIPFDEWYWYKAPEISSINPTEFTIGDEITISGTVFGDKNKNSILFNDIEVNGTDCVSWSDTEIKVIVPYGTTSGTLKIKDWISKIPLCGSNEVEYTIEEGNEDLVWEACGPSEGSVTSLIVDSNGDYYAGVSVFGTLNGIYKSTNVGYTWEPTCPNCQSFTDWFLTENNNVIYGTNLGRVYYSKDLGLTWKRSEENEYPEGTFYLLFDEDNILYTSASNGVYMSTNNGKNWIRRGLSEQTINSLVLLKSTLFAGTNQGIYRSTNQGESWNCMAFCDKDVFTLYTNGNEIYAGIYKNGVQMSSDNGVTWVELGMTARNVFSLTKSNDILYAGADYADIWKFKNGRWSNILNNKGRPWKKGNCLLINADDIVAGTDYGIKKSTDQGSTWIENIKGINCATVNSLFINENNLVIGTNNGVKLSTDYGQNWENIGLRDSTIWSVIMINETIIAGSNNLFFSTNMGLIWEKSNISGNTYAFIKIYDNVFAGTSDGIYKTTDDGRHWIQVGLKGQSIYSIVINNDYIFAGTMDNGIYRSSDNGKNWVQFGLKNNTIYSLSTKKNKIYAGTANNGVYLSTDDGENWTTFGLNDYRKYRIRSLTATDHGILAGSELDNWGIFMTKDDGKSWNQIGLNHMDVISLIINEDYIFAGTNNNGLFKAKLK